MDHRSHFTLLADYNLWANRRLVDGLSTLSDADWHADHGLFFESIHGTLNHIVVVEQLWPARLAGKPWTGKSLNDIQDPTRAGLIAKLYAQNALTKAAMHALPDTLPARLQYTSTEGKKMDVPLAPVLAHLFNHGTHHRGQITAAAERLGLTVQELDIPYFLADMKL
jgi:uncharacterized damage-inducible protein DinB